jgi:hypothetical protein
MVAAAGPAAGSNCPGLDAASYLVSRARLARTTG